MREKKIVVIDGQGGRMGSAIVAGLKAENVPGEIIAVGTNSAATAASSRSMAFLLQPSGTYQRRVRRDLSRPRLTLIS